jgi:tRNA-splicing ligase RtcB
MMLPLGVRDQPSKWKEGHMHQPAIFGTHDQKTLDQLADVASRAERVALMADGHLGYVMPIGGVAAYDDKVSVVGVGFDIACGNCAIQTNLLEAHFDRRRLEELADAIQSEISFGIGRKNTSETAPVNHPLFQDAAWEALPGGEREPLRDKARAQLGTVGSGNHYVDVLADEHGRLWVGVHFGSRGLGHTIASGFLALSQGQQWGTRVPEAEALLDLNQPLGHDYWSLMELAGRYAYAGREWVTRKVVRMLGGEELDMVYNHHNFAWREEHDGRQLIVVRKGATPAFPGQRGFVGGSMGDDAVILSGADVRFLGAWGPKAEVNAMQRSALFSTVHGAGRVMSRTEAAGKVKRRKVWSCGQRECRTELPIQTALGPDGANPRCPSCDAKMHRRETRELVRPGRVTQEMMDSWLSASGVVLRGGGLDESPHVYRRLPDVLAAQGPTVVIEQRLHPLVVVMAGADTFDPYKD